MPQHMNLAGIIDDLTGARRADVTQFTTMIDELRQRHTQLGGDPDTVTVVFGAGQNPVANFTHLTDTGLHFVGSIPPSDCPDLLALPAAARRIVDTDRFADLSAHDTRRTVYGHTRRVILTHSPSLHRSQSEAEFGFRQLKDPDTVSFSPMHHWTEHNIRVHTQTCVFALMVAHLMRRQAKLAGLDLSVRART
jgi:transposase